MNKFQHFDFETGREPWNPSELCRDGLVIHRNQHGPAFGSFKINNSKFYFLADAHNNPIIGLWWYFNEVDEPKELTKILTDCNTYDEYHEVAHRILGLETVETELLAATGGQLLGIVMPKEALIYYDTESDIMFRYSKN